MGDDLLELRDKIDALDQEIQVLITERACAAQQVAHTKQQSQDSTFYRAEREAQVLRQVMERNKGPLSDEEMARLFREIMSACLALEQVMSIAFLGPAGTFTQAAALKHFGHSIKTVPLTSIGDVFREVESGAVSYGVVPVENSTEGVINHTLDEFMSSSLNICGEVILRIHHNLLSTAENRKKIKKIYSHQQSLGQCRKWLDSNMPDVEIVDVSSNAAAAAIASKEENSAAIAGETAAEIYALNILVANIEDEPDNTTRFLIIGKRDTPPSGEDKTSLLITTPNQAGALLGILQPFAKHGISMTRIESRPSRRETWDYVFFVDIDGHENDEKVKLAITELNKAATMVNVLGSFPKAVL
ncbi:prephenate dehydratase [Beggiatoa alba]|nr:prephenate dehydratase [Beggiatoa alba]